MTLSDVSGATSVMLASYEHRDFQESVKTFLARRVSPDYEEWRRAGAIPSALFNQAAEDGFIGIAVPEEYGGLGIADRRFSGIVATEAMRAGATDLALILGLHNDVVVPALVGHAPDSAREQWLPHMASGDVLGAVVYGAEVSRNGDEGVVNGHTEFVVGGAAAGLLLVVGKDGAVVIDSAADGVTRDASAPGIGLAAAGFADISFDAVTGTALDGESAASILTDLFLTTAITAAAGAEAALRLTLDYVRDRSVFGVPLGSLQNSRRALAEAASQVQAAVAFSDACLFDLLGDGLDVARAAACADHAISVYRAVVDAGVQLHGGYGYIMEYPIAHAYADAQFWELHGGGAATRHEVLASALLA